jgi:bifunctional DNA-binding transcriptional regulator/antitoxin component of YhaV-PrlF toxin-antitoxin module
MRFQCLVCLLLAGLAYGQTVPPAAPPAAGAKAGQSAPAAPAKAPEIKVGPDDAVITLKGFCSDATLTGDACKTTISRAQFDKLAEALQPGMSPAIRRQLASQYPSMLKMSGAAKQRGLDKGPTFEEKMNFARMQILSQELRRVLQEDSGKVSDGDVADYYQKNEASYEQATFAKIFIPRAKQIVSPVVKPETGTKAGAKPSAKQPPTKTQKEAGEESTKEEDADAEEEQKAGDEAMKKKEADAAAQKKAAEEAMKQVAADIRARAAKGEDPDKLQKEAYLAAGLPGNPPNTKMEKVRRTTLPANHKAVMDLKPGEVSELISDPNNGHYIYILVSKETVSLESVTPEIRKAISSQRYRDSMQGFQSNVELNDAYFGPARNPAMPPPHGGKPPAEHAEDKD